MKKLKTIVCLLIIALLTMGIISCGNKIVTLNALFMKQAGYSEEDVTAGTAEFQKANPNINVQLTFVPYEALEQKIITSAQAGGYDVVLSDGPFTPKFAQAGIVQAFPELTKEEKDDIFTGAIDACVYKGSLYGMPWLNDCKYLFYNKKMLKDAGFENPPKTWAELLSMAKAIKDKKLVKYPIVWSWKQAECLMCDFTILSAVFGGTMFDNDGNPQLTTVENKNALDFMYQSIKDGLSNPKSTEFTEEDVRGTFSGGNAAFALNWTYMYNMAKDPKESKVTEDVVIALIPGTDKAPSATVNGGQPLSISAGCKQSASALKYIKYMAGKDFQKKYCKNALPIWQSLYDDPDVIASSPDVVKIAKEQYKYIVNRPKVPFYSEFSTFMQVKIQEVLLGKTTSVAALQEAQTKALDLLNKK